MSQYEKEESSDRYSLRGKVFHQLREDILSGHYKEHEELREMAISEEMGVSRTPVREALRQLELEGLVSIIPNKGAYVTGITRKDVEDIYAIRSLLEGLCARWATAYITEKQLDALEENIYLSEFHASKGHAQKLTELDDQFHDILYEACSSKMLEHQLRDFHEYVRRMRKQNLSGSERGLEAVLEHKLIKDELLLPYIDLKTEYYDLGLEHRNETDDQVTIDSANATLKYGVAVKCATITPNAARMEEYHLKKMWKSPNGTIRSILDGTVFRAPILVKGIRPCVRNWEKPITLARHAYGDVYKNTEIRVEGPGKAELVFTAADGTETRELIHDFTSAGVLQGMHNTDKSITSFAHACFNYAVDTKQDLWFATKDTISKKYDHTFKDIFQEIYENEYQEKFKELGIEYFYTLIDDAVARVMKAKGGFIWACKNYDGDVMSDMVSSAFGSLAMMTSVLVSPAGVYEYEAAHGTVQRHYYKHLKGEETSTNSVATIFAWTGALRKRGELDKLPELCAFADKLEKATLDTIESGRMTKDLALITELTDVTVLNSQDFIKAIRKTMEK